MGEEHLPQVLAIERASFPSPWPRHVFLSELRNRSDSHLRVALDQSAHPPLVLGFSCYWLISDEAHIANIAVHPRFRRLGIGNGLLESLMEEARSKGARRATLEVRVSNEAAQALYRRKGFTPVAIRKKYYSDTDEDAIIMWHNDL
ncbi:MAG: ribosomal protein S18-alanine N-acetyltransferase [Candidatus Bathyarchaeia archaeon]